MNDQFSEVFKKLRQIMLPYATRLNCKEDTDQKLSIYTNHIKNNQKRMWFGGVEINKNYVSYHLMPVYVNPDLLQNISPELKKRMQGKSCFNFKSVEEQLFAELEELTKKGYKDFEDRRYC
mgnify:CR=1 FL=1